MLRVGDLMRNDSIYHLRNLEEPFLCIKHFRDPLSIPKFETPPTYSCTSWPPTNIRCRRQKNEQNKLRQKQKNASEEHNDLLHVRNAEKRRAFRKPAIPLIHGTTYTVTGAQEQKEPGPGLKLYKQNHSLLPPVKLMQVREG